MRFNVIINDGPEQYYQVRTGVYRDAAAAVPAVLGLPTPVTVEIWHEVNHPRAQSFTFLVKENEFGGLVTEHLIRGHQQNGSKE